MKPVLHIMVGMPGSGKTTYAKRLEEATGAIRFTPDEWQLKLFGNDMGSPDHDRRHTAVEDIQWALARQLLQRGVSVIMDFGYWGIDERQCLYDTAKALGAFFRVHYLDVPMEELLRRVEKRNADPEGEAFTVTEADMRLWYSWFEPVTPQELAGYADLLPEEPADE